MSDAPIPAPATAPTYLEATRWRCEACNRAEVVSYVKEASVYEVLHVIEESHRKQSPDCPGFLGRIRVEPADPAKATYP